MTQPAPVVVYYQDDCPPCHVAMEYLSRKGVPFVAKDVRADGEAMRELVEDLDSRSTPTIVVDGRIMIGFEKGKLDAMLAAAGF